MSHTVRTPHVQHLIKNGLLLAQLADGVTGGTVIPIPPALRPEHPEATVEEALLKAALELRHAAEELEEEYMSCRGWAQ